MIHFFTFDGKSSRDCGLVISGGGTFGAPERDAEQVEIPGRNGALTISRNRFKNITVSYSAFLRRDFAENAAALRAWLLGGEGYRRLEDTYHPDSFRMARFSGPLEFETGFLNRTGEVTLSFDCKPQRFLKSGELAAAYTAPAVLYNDGFPALPLIKVMGTGAGNLYAGGGYGADPGARRVSLSGFRHAERLQGDAEPEQRDPRAGIPRAPARKEYGKLGRRRRRRRDYPALVDGVRGLRGVLFLPPIPVFPAFDPAILRGLGVRRDRPLAADFYRRDPALVDIAVHIPAVKPVFLAELGDGQVFH